MAQDSQGTWIATDRALLYVVSDLWSFYTAAQGLPSDRVRMVAPDAREVWAATPRGLGRMDRSSRRWEVFSGPAMLPSDNVLSVAVDDRFVWVGTDSGAARFDKVSRDWKQLTGEHEPSSIAVHDVAAFGQSVWFATANGVYIHDRQTQSWTHLGEQEGLRLGEVLEIVSLGEQIWLFCQKGLARYDQRSRAISLYTEKEGLPSPRVSAFATVQGEIWIGTDRGLVVYSPGSDSLSPFSYQKGMPEGVITGIEAAVPWIWVSTDRALGVFSTIQRVWAQKKADDGLADPHLEGMSLAGSSLILIQPSGFQSYHVQRDEWGTMSDSQVWSGEGQRAAKEGATRWNLEFTVSGDATYNLSSGSSTSQLVPDVRLGAGTQLDSGRTLDGSVRLDMGDVNLPGVRNYEAQLRLMGNERDSLKELLLSNELLLRQAENTHPLLDRAWLEGVGIYQRLGAEKDSKRELLTLSTEIGVNRGVRYREFFRGSIEYSYQLAKRYLTPGSEVVLVDGAILERGVDYVLIHTTGQLTFLNPDQVNALSLIEITYTYEQIPRKDTASQSILEMLPWDNEIGGFGRAGNPVYVTDEGGLYAQIDGAAPKYLDRGWVESVFLDYAQGSTKVSVQIHDLGTPEQAKELFAYDRPVSYVTLWEDEESVALLDQGLPAGYAVKMVSKNFYVELSIDEKSRAAEILIGLFAQAIRTKGDLSGTLQDSFRPWVGRLHLGLSPSEKRGLGVGYLFDSDIADSEVEERIGKPRSQYDLATLDGWTHNTLGSGDYGGSLSSFVQVGQGAARPAGGDIRRGYGASGNVIYNSQAINLRLDGEAHSREFQTLGTRQTALGTLASDLRSDLSWSPIRWLNLRMLYDQQRSYLDPSLEAAAEKEGISENLLGKLAFMKARWPTLWALAGRSVLSGGGRLDEKLRFAGSFEYDLAQGILSRWNLRKLAIKAYWDRSENEVPESASSAPSLRAGLLNVVGTAENLRLELKAAPTRTEDSYVRFEQKTFAPQAVAGTQSADMESWDLIMGASSRLIEGLIPTFNGKMSYARGADTSGNLTERASTLLSGSLDLFPGRFVERLGRAMLSIGYGFTSAEEAENEWKKQAQDKHQVDGRAAVGKYDDALRWEGRGKWWTVREGASAEEIERYVETSHRFTYRPIYVSPITLRLDASELRRRVEGVEGTLQSFLLSVEWERRWSQDLVTKLRLESPIRVLTDSYDELLKLPVTYEDWGLRPWAEIRYRLRELWWQSLLRMALRASVQWIDWFDAHGPGAENAWELSSSGFLDWEKAGAFVVRLGATYTRHSCLERLGTRCASYDTLQPSLTALGRF